MKKDAQALLATMLGLAAGGIELKQQPKHEFSQLYKQQQIEKKARRAAARERKRLKRASS